RTDRQPPGAAGVQPDAPPGAATGSDLQPVSRAIPPRHGRVRSRTERATRAITVACDGVALGAQELSHDWRRTIPSPVLVTVGVGSASREGRGPRWQEEGAENDAGPVSTPRRKYHHRR